jgi:tight adherence protein C
VNTRLLVLGALAGWVGATLLLSQLRWCDRTPMVARLRPFIGGGPAGAGRVDTGTLSAASLRAVLAPMAREVGETLGRWFGASEELDARLRRIHSSQDATQVRTRQVAWSAAGLAGAVVATQAVALPGAAMVIVLVGGPLLGFLVVEARVAQASTRWQQRTFLELPVVAEQLGMLLSAGYSLGGALHRLAARGHGACRTDLEAVCARVHQGLSEIDAAREWAERVQVPEVTRLVDVLALNREASDLGRLIAEEARATRREVQRRTLETIERRGQQVWIPVTVATLLPGVLFLAVPFFEAMRLFADG